MNEEDKTRLYRDVRLTLKDMENLVMAINDTKAFYFRAGIQDRYREWEALATKIKLYMIKE